MLASTIVDYFAAHIINKGRRKLGMAISLCSNLGILFYFKYANFSFNNFQNLCSLLNIESISLYRLPEITLPIGISFYTFQTLSYTIDVYRGNIKANRNFIDFGCYVTMFPQLVAGPIVRYVDIKDELIDRTVTSNKIALGIERFMVGLAKKVLIANTFAYIADSIFELPSYAMDSALVAWFGIISYSIQIYFDFSGYSDMAIGLGLIMGFNIPENFNYPYISKSIKEFWRRWHISLSHWFRDYVYISLGGNRLGRVRTYINLFIVFLLTGLWHGAKWNFIIWGIYHGTLLVIERLGFGKFLNRLWPPIQHFYTLFLVAVGWVFFRANDLEQAIFYLKKMFTINIGQSIISINHYINNEIIFIGICAIFLSTPVYKKFRIKIEEYKSYQEGFLNYLFKLALLSIFILSILYLSSSNYSPFIYYRF